jgi:hypothetical protein
MAYRSGVFRWPCCSKYIEKMFFTSLMMSLPWGAMVGFPKVSKTDMKYEMRNKKR